MKKTVALAGMIVILLLQPLLVMNVGTGHSTSLMDTPVEIQTPAQDEGFRIDPDDLLPHVPIVIDEDSDFDD
ncbi:MAG: hypothetical protein RTU30_15355, partial [Candidatus Thorarchaeota archaeon]